MRNIKRIDTGNTHGWQVVIQRGGQEYSKLFSDKKHGGRDQALEKAKAHRQQLLGRLPDIPEGRNIELLHSSEMRDRAWQTQTRTGVKGIGFSMEMQKTRRYPYVQAMGRVNGKRKATSFSVEKHGLGRALMLCCHRRVQWQGATINKVPERACALYHQALEGVARVYEKETGESADLESLRARYPAADQAKAA